MAFGMSRRAALEGSIALAGAVAALPLLGSSLGGLRNLSARLV